VKITAEITPSPLTVTLEVDEDFDPYGNPTPAMRAAVDALLLDGLFDAREYAFGRMDYA